MNEQQQIILPGDPRFQGTLQNPWLFSHKYGSKFFTGAGGNWSGALVVRASGLLEPASAEDLDEYLYGGEYDVVVGEEDTCGFVSD